MADLLFCLVLRNIVTVGERRNLPPPTTGQTDLANPREEYHNFLEVGPGISYAGLNIY